MAISHHQCYYPLSLNYLSDNFLSWSFTYDSKTLLCLICLRVVVNIAERVMNKCHFFIIFVFKNFPSYSKWKTKFLNWNRDTICYIRFKTQVWFPFCGAQGIGVFTAGTFYMFLPYWSKQTVHFRRLEL